MSVQSAISNICCHWIGLVFYSPSAAILTYMPWEATTLLVSKIDHLKLLLNDVLKIEDCRVQRARLHYCIRYHQEILRQVLTLLSFFFNLFLIGRIFQDLRGCFKKTFSVCVLAASIILSCLCAEMLKVSTICQFFKSMFFLEVICRYCGAFLWLHRCYFFVDFCCSENLGWGFT